MFSPKAGPQTSWRQLERAIAGCHADEIAALDSAIRAISPASLRSFVEQLLEFGPRSERDPDAQRKTLELLTSSLEGLGELRVESFGTAPGDRNVVLTLPGEGAADEVLELAAHFDTVPGSPGADDNASAVAGLVELARVFSRANRPKTLRLCFFGREESGLVGSRSHVKRVAGAAERLAGLIVLEMIGYADSSDHSQHTPVRIPFLCWPPHQADFIAVVSDFRSRHMSDAFVRASARSVPEQRVFAVRGLGSLLRDGARSDHMPYWQQGIPALMITDTANFRNPHYHKPSDTLDTLNFTFLTQVTRSVAATVLHWLRT